MVKYVSYNTNLKKNLVKVNKFGIESLKLKILSSSISSLNGGKKKLNVFNEIILRS